MVSRSKWFVIIIVFLTFARDRLNLGNLDHYDDLILDKNYRWFTVKNGALMIKLQ